MQKQEQLKALEKKIEYRFRDPALLLQAITHSSYTNEQKINRTKNYERLEFLGDAVLEMVTSAFLFRRHPELPEGELSRLRASLVCEPSLAFCAKELGLGKFLLLGKGEESTGGRRRASITSDVLEALIGAVYLDGGLTAAQDFIYRFVLSEPEQKQLFSDSKTHLQELLQGMFHKDCEYRLVGENGPEHDKTFVAEVLMDGNVIGTGEGRTKKAAQQQAAYQALLACQDDKTIGESHTFHTLP
ncbi:MAG: ribonuclease III [Clostridium sp.]|nr:ribonuclease III [Clostridium sp.]